MSDQPDLLAPFGLPPLFDPQDVQASHPGLRAGDRLDLIAAKPAATLRAEPSASARALSDILFGEPLQQLDRRQGWLQVISLIDSYVGWLAESDVLPYEAAPSHRVVAPLCHRYAAPDLKSPPVGLLPMGAFVTASARAEKGWLPLREGGWIYLKHLAPIGTGTGDPVDVAESFIGSPYLWGGRSKLGIDCSGLIQVALARTGFRIHRDSGPQFMSLGRPLTEGAAPMRGDLAFFPGHVGWMIDSVHLLHANATHMAVTIDPVDEVTGWVAAQTDKPPFLGFRRLTD